MTVEHMNESSVSGVKPNELKTARHISRRDFIKLAGLGMGAFTVTNSWLGQYIGDLKPELSPVRDALSEYDIAWQARPWVWTNLAIASQRLDGTKIMPGQEVSINQLLGFDDMRSVSRDNTDPRIGYVAAQMSDPSKLDGWGYGLCLGSTTIFRTCLNSPLQITERGTHYEIYPDYFKDMPVGTDAAIFKPDPGDILPETDLKLRNPTNQTLTLNFGVYDVFGEKIEPPKKEVSQIWYKATYLDQLVRVLRRKLDTTTGWELPRQYVPENAFGNQKVVVRSAVVGSGVKYDVSLSPIRHGDSTLDEQSGIQDYMFTRTLNIVEGESQRVINEIFVSNYGHSPIASMMLDRP